MGTKKSLRCTITGIPVSQIPEVLHYEQRPLAKEAKNGEKLRERTRLSVLVFFSLFVSSRLQPARIMAELAVTIRRNADSDENQIRIEDGEFIEIRAYSMIEEPIVETLSSARRSDADDMY